MTRRTRRWLTAIVTAVVTGVLVVLPIAAQAGITAADAEHP